MLRRVFMVAALGAMAAGAKGSEIQEGVSTEFVKTSVQTIDSVAYHVWEMLFSARVDWTNSRMDLSLSSGSMYNDPAGGVTEPDPGLFGTHPNLRWDTYVTVPAGVGADVVLPGESVMEDTVVGISWADLGIDDGGGTWKLAQISLSDDATGWVEATSFTVGTYFIPRTVHYPIEQGQIVPEPATIFFLLPGLWLRRRKKQCSRGAECQ